MPGLKKSASAEQQRPTEQHQQRRGPNQLFVVVHRILAAERKISRAPCTPATILLSEPIHRRRLIINEIMAADILVRQSVQRMRKVMIQLRPPACPATVIPHQIQNGVPMKISLRAIGAFLLSTLATLIAPSLAAAAEPLKTAVNERGLAADLYVPAKPQGAQLPAIIVLGGSEGGLGAGAAHEAQLIAAHGYVVLQLAYFDAPGLPKDLGLIPLEYFKTAIDWLSAHPGVDPQRIGIEGTSIGGEVALVVASHYPHIRAVAAAVPSSVVWPGISRTSASPASTFTLAGKPLADLPYGWNGPTTSIYDLYAKGLPAIGKHPDAIISVERINGPIILVCGEKDVLWPSCLMTEQIARRLKAHAFKYSVKQLKYADAGHAAFGPPEPHGSDKIQKLAALGGTGAGNQAARLDDWPKVMAFMDAALNLKTVPAEQ